MGFIDAAIYVAIAQFMLPAYRYEVPFMQMGYDLERVVLFCIEISLYEAAIYNIFQEIACFFAHEWGASVGICLPYFKYEDKYLDRAESFL